MRNEANSSRTLLCAARQHQFLDVICRDEAEERLRQHIRLSQLGEEDVSLSSALGRRRADWGFAIETVARQYNLGSFPLQAEHYDFVIPSNRINRDAVQRFLSASHPINSTRIAATRLWD